MFGFNNESRMRAVPVSDWESGTCCCLGMRYTDSEGGSGSGLEADVLGLGGTKTCPRDFPWELSLSSKLILATESVSGSLDLLFLLCFFAFDLDEDESESESELEEVDWLLDECFLLFLLL